MAAAAIPAAIGLGGSVFSGITGKNAAKKQQQLAEQQMAQLKPLIDAQVQGAQYGIGQSKNLFNQSAPFIQGAGQAVHDLQNFWSPLVHGNQSAIQQMLAPEIGGLNKSRQAINNSLAKAPRGPGRLTAFNNNEANYQGQLNALTFGARKEGANQLANLANMLQGLGLGTGQLATSTLGAGLNGGQNAFNLLQGQQNRAFQAGQDASSQLGGLGKSLGGFLTDIFKNTSGGSGLTYNKPNADPLTNILPGGGTMGLG